MTKPLDKVGVDADLDADVPCVWEGCPHPATKQARLHLREARNRPELGCATRTVFICEGHWRLLMSDHSDMPYVCLCGHLTVSKPQDCVVWVRDLR